MTKLTNNTVHDEVNVLSEKQQELTTLAQKEALERLVAFSHKFQLRIRSALGVVDGTRAENLILRRKTVFSKAEEQLLRRVRESLTHEELHVLHHDVPKTIDLGPLEFTIGVGINKQYHATLDTTNIHWDAKEEDLRRDIEKKGAVPAEMQKFIKLPSTAPAGTILSKDQAKALADVLLQKLLPYRPELRASLGGRDVSPLNQSMAVNYAKALPLDVLEKALNPDAGKAKDLEKLRALALLNRTLGEFAKLPLILPTSENYEKAIEELAKVEKDIEAFNLGKNSKAKCAKLKKKRLPDFSAPKDERDGFETLLSNEQTRLKELVGHYRKMEVILTTIYKASESADKKAKPASFTKLMPAGKIAPAELTAALSVKDLVTEWQGAAGFNLENKDFDAEVSEAMKKSHSKPITGSAAVLAIYKAYIRHTQPDATEEDIQEVANALLTQNDIDNGAIKEIREVLRGVFKGMGKEVAFNSDIGQVTKNFLFGSHRKFIKHLEHACDIHGPVDQASTLHLTTLYFALRKSLEENHLSRGDKVSKHVYNMFLKVGTLLATRSLTQDEMDELNLKKDDHGHDKKEGDAAHAAEPKKSKNVMVNATRLLTLPLSELPAEYQEGVQHAVDVAVSRTGRKRRAIGHIFGGTVGSVAGYIKNSAMLPINAGTNLVSTTVGLPKAATKKGWSILKGIGGYLNEKKPFLGGKDTAAASGGHGDGDNHSPGH
jgi:hypothetical protein